MTSCLNITTTPTCAHVRAGLSALAALSTLAASCFAQEYSQHRWPPTPREQLAQYLETYDSYDYPHPVFEAAFKWLEQRLPEADELTLVHGDFRNGNLIVGPEGIRAVLDWELTHVGDPAEDLGWLCVNSWRFGETKKVAGGFGSVEQLLEGYRAGGGSGMTTERVRFWEIFGTLKWGIMCMTMYQAFAQGTDRSVERAAIGRRSSETEIDLVNILYDRLSPP